MSTIVPITPGKGFEISAALKLTPSASRHHPFRPLGGSYLCPCYARKYLPATISNNLLFLKISTDYFITKLLDSMLVNFSQSKHSVRTRFNFYV